VLDLGCPITTELLPFNGWLFRLSWISCCRVRTSPLSKTSNPSICHFAKSREPGFLVKWITDKRYIQKYNVSVTQQNLPMYALPAIWWRFHKPLQTEHCTYLISTCVRIRLSFLFTCAIPALIIVLFRYIFPTLDLLDFPNNFIINKVSKFGIKPILWLYCFPVFAYCSFSKS
jgi:hypothetical protein